MVRRKTAEASLVGKTSLRVRFSEVDSMQIVWHGEYVRYFEDGREAFGREFAGLGYMDIHASGYTAPIVELQLQYKKPLRVNDTAVVETRYIATEAAKICFEYTIRSGTDGEIVAEGSSTQVFLDARGELQLLAPEFYRKWKERWDERPFVRGRHARSGDHLAERQQRQSFRGRVFRHCPLRRQLRKPFRVDLADGRAVVPCREIRPPGAHGLHILPRAESER